MTYPTAHLAIDLGAESGRAVIGTVDEGGIHTQEVHRFPHYPKVTKRGLCWDLSLLQRAILTAFQKAHQQAAENGPGLASVGVDAWGVDFSLLDGAGRRLLSPMCYREPANNEVFARICEQIAAPVLFAKTGVQPLAINTLTQLVRLKEREPDILRRAKHLLFVPDLIHQWLCGERKTERTILSTGQLTGVSSDAAVTEVFARFQLPVRLLPEVVGPGTCLGETLPFVTQATGMPPLKVIAPASHDTASAVAAIPARPEQSWAYLSSGTWSLLGVERTEPCLSEAAQKAGFTNECGAGDRILFHKNLPGLWLWQECRREWAAEGYGYDYQDMETMARNVRPFQSMFDPSDPRFLNPGGMARKIAEFAGEHSLPQPGNHGEILRTCLESLALSYRQAIEELAELLGNRPQLLHVVGGGARNRLLNEMTARATRCRLVVGPIEAAAIGNLAMQAFGSETSALERIRAATRAYSGPSLQKLTAAQEREWEQAFEKFVRLCAK